MCVAYPGKILSIENHHARVDFTGSVVPVNISMVDVAPGDYVLVHAGMAIQKWRQVIMYWCMPVWQSRKWKQKKQKSGSRCSGIWKVQPFKDS